MLQIEQFPFADLYLGDAEEVLPQLAGTKINLVLTDPPYGHDNAKKDLASALKNFSLVDRRNGKNVLRRPYATKMMPIANDSPERMREVVSLVLDEAVKLVTRPGTVIMHCAGGGPKTTLAWAINRLDARGLTFFHQCVWDKINPGFGWRYKRQHEHILIAHPDNSRVEWSGMSKALPNVIRMPTRPNQHGERLHPNEKPESLLSPFVLAHTFPGQVVADPFMGSGTTGVVAVRMGRHFIGIEKDPKHFDAARKRIEAAHRQMDLFVSMPAMPCMDQMDLLEGSSDVVV